MPRMEKLVDKVDTELFIGEVEKHPCLWDSSVDSYGDKIAKRNAWEAILTYFIADFEEKTSAEKKELGNHFQRKWKSLRSCFTRELAKQKSEKKLGLTASSRKAYVYFEQLKFLETAIKRCKTSAESENEDDPRSDGEESSMTERERCAGPSARRAKKAQRTETIEDDVKHILGNKYLHLQDTDDDEDKYFMLSLVSELKKVPDYMKLDVKAKLLSVFSQASMEYHRIDGSGGGQYGQQFNRPTFNATAGQIPGNSGQFPGYSIQFPDYSFNNQGIPGNPDRTPLNGASLNVTIPVTVAPVYQSMAPSHPSQQSSSQQVPKECDNIANSPDSDVSELSFSHD